MTWRFLPYSLPLRIPYSWAKGTQRERLGLWVVREPDDGGLAGWGETAPPPHLGIPGQDLAFQAKAALEEATDALELGAALDAIGTEPRIRHGLLCAALDAQARAEGVPLARLLARRHGIARQPAAQVPVNALVGAVPPAE
ncbi:MAG TPA: hypothetical protein VFH47_01545, partial [Candidatus Thermoplasmatota archaeon]|nr:hypothetical protein [Candidatus Thermoplasmatota archaeon]